jgi:hypothetical protein
MYKTLMILLLFCSCIKVEKKLTIDELVVFGSRGFCFKDSANWIFDSTKLDIRGYFEFKKDSFIRKALRKYNEPIEYFSVRSTDTIGCNNLVNRLLLFKNYQKNYYSNELEIYDGLNYTLFCKTSDNKEYLINYVPHHLPDSLEVLHEFIEKILISKNLETIDNFEFHKITEKAAIEAFKRRPPPPKPLNKEIKFRAPKI